MQIGDATKTAFLGAVVAAWAVSLFVGVAQKDWTALTLTTPIVAIAAGSVFGIKTVLRQKNGDN